MQPLLKVFENLNNLNTKIAVIDSKKSYSYADIAKCISNLQSRILDSNQTTIYILANNNLESISCIIACLLLGVTYVPLSSNAPFLYINKQLTQVGSGLLFYKETDIKYSSNELNMACDSLGIKTSCFSQVFSNKTSHAKLKFSENSQNRPAYTFFTSGSTGIPKAISISHSNLTSFFQNIELLYPFSDQDIFLSFSRITFDLSIFDILTPFIFGTSLAIIDNDRDYLNPLPFIKSSHATVALFVPSAVRLFTSMYREKNRLRTDLRHVFFCGEKLYVDDVQKISHFCSEGARFTNWYGPTEATVACFYHDIKLSDTLNDPIPIGQPFPSTSYTLFPQIDSNLFELVLLGPQVSEFGYLHQKDNTFFVHANIPAYKTGDLVTVQESDLIWVARKDNQIKKNGIRIDLDEIETNIRSLLTDNLSIVLTENNKVTLVLEGPDKDINSIYSKLRESLPHHLCPDKILTVQAIPLNERGKVDKKHLKSII